MPVESSEGRADGGDAGDEDWLGDVIWPAEADQGIPWAGAVGPPGSGGPGEHGRPGRRPGGRGGPLASLIVVAVLAAGAGAGLTFALNGSSGTPSAATSTPSPGGVPGAGSGTLPGGASSGEPGGDQASQMLLIGTVTAVSAASITIGGNGPPVTAAVTGSTRVTGRVSSIGGIRPGDVVSAQLTQSGGRVLATAIQYPARQASGGAGAP